MFISNSRRCRYQGAKCVSRTTHLSINRLHSDFLSQTREVRRPTAAAGVRMSEVEGTSAAPAAAVATAAAGAGRVLHARSFKLRFAAQREPGRSDVSAVEPLGLPATVTDKFYRRAETPGAEASAEAGRRRRALRRIQDMFGCGPRDKYPAPYTSSHVYGWWWDEASKIATTKFSDRRLHHHIQDSAWLKARLLVLAADDKLKQK